MLPQVLWLSNAATSYTFWKTALVERVVRIKDMHKRRTNTLPCILQFPSQLPPFPTAVIFKIRNKHIKCWHALDNNIPNTITSTTGLLPRKGGVPDHIGTTHTCIVCMPIDLMMSMHGVMILLLVPLCVLTITSQQGLRLKTWEVSMLEFPEMNTQAKLLPSWVCQTSSNPQST